MTAPLHSFTAECECPVPRAELAAWHWRRGALERLVPGWSGVRVVRSLDGMSDGAIAELDVPIAAGVHTRIKAVHEDVRPGERFVDRMLHGPFPHWRHTHSFRDGSAGGSRLEDRIEYRLPLGFLGGRMVRRDLERMFRWRHERTRRDLARHREMGERLGGRALRVAITGATGLVGASLAAFLSTGGHEAIRVVRKRERPSDIVWDIARGEIERDRLEGLDAVVHLAGEPIAGRWNRRRREAIRTSRVRGTELIATALASATARPEVLVSASAIGFYGDRPESRTSPLDEFASAGAGYLAEVCQAWEAAARPAADAGIRVVHPRIGMVLAGGGGALQAMLTPFRLGLGGPIGDGRQGVSWIALDDLLGSILFAIATPLLRGPYNAVAPISCAQADFARALGSVLRRPAVMPLPAAAVSVLFGEMGRELLLAGAHIAPSRLASSGFRFDMPDLPSALRFELGRLERGRQ